MFERPKTAEKQLEVIDFVEKWMQGKDADLDQVRRSMGVISEEIAKRNAQIQHLNELISSSTGTEAEIHVHEMTGVRKQLGKLETLRESVEAKMNRLIGNLEDAEEELDVNRDSFKENLN